jgi:hypothetical protein
MKTPDLTKLALELLSQASASLNVDEKHYFWDKLAKALDSANLSAPNETISTLAELNEKEHFEHNKIIFTFSSDKNSIDASSTRLPVGYVFQESLGGRKKTVDYIDVNGRRYFTGSGISTYTPKW